jgi:chromosome segregation ATPase
LDVVRHENQFLSSESCRLEVLVS